MLNQNCFECVYKHLSVALSYAKQVLGGYDGNNELNHEIDLLGELVNAEHHLELINDDYYNELKAIRKQLVAENFNVNETFIDAIRKVFNKVRNFEKSIDKNMVNKASNPIIPSYNQKHYYIVFQRVSNADYFSLSYQSIQNMILNSVDVIVLKSDVELSVKPLNKTLMDFCNEIEDENFVLMKENQVILKQFDFNFLRNTFNQKDGLNWNADKPQMINRKKYIEKMENTNDLNVYFNDEKPANNDFFYTVFVDQKVCCSVKNRLHNLPFCAFNENGYNELTNYLKNK